MSGPDQPLDYQPRGAAQVSLTDPASAAPPTPPSVVPAEFETLLTSTTDHGAAQAIRLALETAGIDVAESNDGTMVDRVVKLFVRAGDAEQAAPIAAGVIARRDKFRTFPKPRVDPPSGGGTLPLDVTDLLL